VVLVPWIPGEILGGFDMEGRKRDDPNDRIAHEDRRSLRASFVLAAWLSVLDPSSVNTLDTLVEENGRRFVRHYFIDFGAALGSATNHPAGLADGGQHLIEVGRTIKAFFGLGFYRRPFQLDKDVWRQAVQRYPNVGWFPAERFDPDDYHPNRKNPAHVRATDRDLYWGAKLVTAFTDAQIAALVDQARFPRPEADYVLHALRVRRDIIGRRYLGPMTAVERPAMAAGDAEVCFSDLGVDRGLARPDAIRYAITISDGLGQRLSSFEQQAGRARTCVPVGPGPGTSGYRIVEVERLGNQAKATRIHLRWRSPERRFVVVGLERDE